MNHGLRSVKRLARNTRCFAQFTKYAYPGRNFGAWKEGNRCMCAMAAYAKALPLFS